MSTTAGQTKMDAPGVRPHGRWYYAGLGMMGVFYIFAGSVHFRNPGFYLPIMPPYIPWPSAMIAISGAAEILGGLGVLIPNGFVFLSTRRAAAWGLAIMLVAFLPVHINMCLHPDQFPAVPLWLIWARLPLQLPLIAWAWWYTRPQSPMGASPVRPA